ncbi:aquaporin transporter, putative, partial [Ricinus communis]
MADNLRVIADEENGYGGRRVQPFASTPLGAALDNTNGGKKQNPTTFSRVLGLEELSSLNVWRASVAEVLGTAALVFATDTIVISTYETETKTPNLIMAALIAMTVTILLTATFPISGGHINPVITISAAFTGLVSPVRAAVYILAQCLGATLGALLVATSCLLFTLTISIISSLESHESEPKILVPLAVFIIAFFFLLTTVPLSGAGINPARCFGPAIVRGDHLWNGHWVFWVGPFIACVAFT